MNRLLVLAAAVATAQDPRALVEEVEKRSRSASQRYEGTLEVVDGRNRIATKKWEYQRIGAYGDSKTLLRFTAPAEVKGVALLVHNFKDRSSDQWMWTPALQRERRIALQDRSTRFFGTDFSFEDLEERDSRQYDYRLEGEETVDGAACYKLSSKPIKTKSSQYTRSEIWVRKDIPVIVRVDSYKGEQLIRRIRYRDFENVKNIWTARALEVEDIPRKSRTVMKLEKLEYNLPMKDSDFTLQSLGR
jgi:hypothetical protein